MVEVVVPAGFLTVVPPGGRVGGLVRPPPARAAEVEDEVAAVLEAEAALGIPGRRTVEVVVPGRFAAPAAVPSSLEPLGADLTVDLGDSVAPVPAVPGVSSPDSTDSSRLTTSKLSDSDMIVPF
jgi:hypothetical protein